MGKTFKMQPWITMKGHTGYLDPLIQPATGWVNGENFKDAVVDIKIASNTVSAGSDLAELAIQTAVAPEGPWQTITTLTPAYTEVAKYYTSREGGTDQFERFLRWKMDGTGASGDWTMTFKICATLK
jgi:hypothetical protein